MISLSRNGTHIYLSTRQRAIILTDCLLVDSLKNIIFPNVTWTSTYNKEPLPTTRNLYLQLVLTNYYIN